MTRQTVQRLMGSPATPFRRYSETDTGISEIYEEADVFAYYSDEGVFEAFEFYPPARVMLGDINLFDLNVGQARAFMHKLDPDMISEPDGFVSRKFCLSFWSDNADEGDEEMFEAILIGRPGYYDAFYGPRDEGTG